MVLVAKLQHASSHVHYMYVLSGLCVDWGVHEPLMPYSRGDSPIKLTGMLVGKLKLNLKFKLTPKGDFCVVRVAAFLINFLMHSPL